MEIWVPTPVAEVRDIVLRLLMVVIAEVETLGPRCGESDRWYWTQSHVILGLG